ncbi:lipopolysaccharide-induced tumor necrosis factor-alpha factor homolog [Melanaphis sacchari]|uniref:lipopolysaccharide-induced tumor necrosis factor-alpha factor homolog n=1 Tax=Melanaphis sacchari TaxID=742174 RepID=UPI000DC155BC|nr:lipopolysaccharide-induced tumor necrosis factor-alpha factor homolog [Melanaphis sacchari]
MYPELTVPAHQNVQCVQTPAYQAPFGPTSVQTTCSSCGQLVFTNTSRKAKAAAWWSCMLLFISGFFCGCCLIPCCMDSCNIVDHTCPKCNAYLGQYRP